MSASCKHSSVFFSMNIVRDKHDSWEKNRSRHFNRFEWAKQRRGGGEIGNCFEGSSGFRHGYPCTGCQGAHGSTRAAYFAIPWRPFLQRQIVLPQPLLPCFLPSPKARKTGPEEQKDGRECWISNSPWSKRERERLIPFCERQEEEILRLDVETQKFLLNEFYPESGCCLGRIRKFCPASLGSILRMPV